MPTTVIITVKERINFCDSFFGGKFKIICLIFIGPRYFLLLNNASFVPQKIGDALSGFALFCSNQVNSNHENPHFPIRFISDGE